MCVCVRVCVEKGRVGGWQRHHDDPVTMKNKKKNNQQQNNNCCGNTRSRVPDVVQEDMFISSSFSLSTQIFSHVQRITEDICVRRIISVR